MLIISSIKQSKVEVEVKSEDIIFPIKIYLEDITVSLSEKESMEMYTKLGQGLQELYITKKSN